MLSPIKVALVALAVATAGTAFAQRPQEARTFNFYAENDVLFRSDRGYTNGLRLSWTHHRFEGWMPRATMFGPQLLLRRLSFAGLIRGAPDSQVGCAPGAGRKAHLSGVCRSKLMALAQTMYTPDTLQPTELVTDDRPYAGLMTFSFGSAFLDSPRAREHHIDSMARADSLDDTLGRHVSQFVLTHLANEFIVGVSGPGSLARETQSLAHWTWAAGSVRPAGWPNQLRGGLQGGVLTRLATRTYWMERCFGKERCSGGLDDEWKVDVTPRAEAVMTSYMVRGTGGFIARGGWNYPDLPGSDRIPATIMLRTAAANSPRASYGARRIAGPMDTAMEGDNRGQRPKPDWWPDGVLGEIPWFNVFVAGDWRYVPYNMFLEGGRHDRGQYGWRSMRGIDARRKVLEGSAGAELGNGRMALSFQVTCRSPEYDVREATRFSGWHRYVTLNLSIHSLRP